MKENIEHTEGNIDYNCKFCKSPICWEVDCNIINK